MKRIILSVAALAFIFGLTLTSCTKDDMTNPVITLIGDNPITINIGGTYTELGATANDDKDGDLTTSIVISGTVNTTTKGTYTITYSATDAAGNEGTATRTVNVVNAAEALTGTYSVHDVVTGLYAGTYDYSVTVTSSSTVNNKLIIQNFGGLGAAVNVNITVNGTIITIPSQDPTGMGDPGTVTGSGLATSSAIVSLNYSITYGGGSDNGNATFTK